MLKEKKEENNLPAYTTSDNIILLLDVYKKKNGKEDEAKMMFGKGNSTYSNTKSALRILELINEDDCTLTESGRTIAYSNEDEKKIEILDVITSYSPYEAVLHNILKEGESFETDIEVITNFWGRFGRGSSQGNLEEAAKLFGNIIQYVGLGQFVIGRKGKKTRVIWNSDAYEIFHETIGKCREAEPANDEEALENQPKESMDKLDDDIEKKDTNELLDESERSIDLDKKIPNIKNKECTYPSITINVDMSQWSEEKIRSFFKYAYGKFDEERE